MHKRVRGLRCNKPDAAGSMVTTAGDYARLLTAILNATGQRKATMDEMLRSQMGISSEQMFGMGAWWDTNKYQPIGLAWGLGWGRFDTEQGRAFFHAGHDVGYQNYTVAYPDKGIGIVLLSNSDNFESVAAEVPSAGDWRHLHARERAERRPPYELRTNDRSSPVLRS